MLERDHQGCPFQVRDESGPRGSNGRTHSATVSDVSDSARSHDPGDLDVHCQLSARQFRSARDCGMRCESVGCPSRPAMNTQNAYSAKSTASKKTIRIGGHPGMTLTGVDG